jgi:hypothetical protein
MCGAHRFGGYHYWGLAHAHRTGIAHWMRFVSFTGAFQALEQLTFQYCSILK